MKFELKIYRSIIEMAIEKGNIDIISMLLAHRFIDINLKLIYILF